MTTTNDAAERLLWWEKQLAARNGSNRGMAEFVVTMLDAALADERRATVEWVRQAITAYGKPTINTATVLDILAEASR